MHGCIWPRGAYCRSESGIVASAPSPPTHPLSPPPIPLLTGDRGIRQNPKEGSSLEWWGGGWLAGWFWLPVAGWLAAACWWLAGWVQLPSRLAAWWVACLAGWLAGWLVSSVAAWLPGCLDAWLAALLVRGGNGANPKVRDRRLETESETHTQIGARGFVSSARGDRKRD
jgi:hypothetical protein